MQAVRWYKKLLITKSRNSKLSVVSDRTLFLDSTYMRLIVESVVPTLSRHTPCNESLLTTGKRSMKTVKTSVGIAGTLFVCLTRSSIRLMSNVI